MRKITKEAATAFRMDKPFKKDNTEVKVSQTETAMYLHGNKIAWCDGENIYLSSCGYTTNTTKERLNGIIEMCYATKSIIYQRSFAWYRDDKDVRCEFVDGELI
jgi:hypothetical protein